MGVLLADLLQHERARLARSRCRRSGQEAVELSTQKGSARIAGGGRARAHERPRSGLRSSVAGAWRPRARQTPRAARRRGRERARTWRPRGRPRVRAPRAAPGGPPSARRCSVARAALVKPRMCASIARHDSSVSGTRGAAGRAHGALRAARWQSRGVAKQQEDRFARAVPSTSIVPCQWWPASQLCARGSMPAISS